MKTSTQKFLATLLFVLFTSVAVNTQVYAVSEPNNGGNGINGPQLSPGNAAALEIIPQSCGVTDQEVVNYLAKYGYKVTSLSMANDGTLCDVIATSQYPYHTIVYISNGIIEGHEDLPY